MSKSGRQKKIEWIIHYVHNGYCEVCEDEENDMLPYMCDAHTHGLSRYGSLEIQFVLDCGEDVGYILNAVGERIRDGLKLRDGDTIDWLTDDGAIVKVFETKDDFGEPILRLIMPDGDFNMPEDSEEYPYNMQYESPYIKDHKKTS